KGGNGGAIASGSFGLGAGGGDAAATGTASSTGPGTVAANVTATGGNGGASSSGPGGFGGNATAIANATGTAAANATAMADAGNGPTGALQGTAVAQANATGTSGTATADAQSGGGLVTSVRAQTVAPVVSTTHADSRAIVSTPASDATDAAGIHASAFATGLPQMADALDYFAGNLNARPHFNLAGDTLAGASSDVFGLVTLGGAFTAGAASKTYTSTAWFSIDLNQLVNPRQNLLVALLDTTSQGAGFDSLQFQITREGVLVVNETFATVAAANAFLDDQILDLGSNAFGNVVGNLDLVFSLSLTTNDAGAGYSFDLLFGNATLGNSDFDEDGDVDGADLLTWQRNFGLAAGATKAQGDANGDGQVNGADLTIFKNQYGYQAESLSPAAAVPEPAGPLLALVAALVIAGRRRAA
ncbi:MAG: hypothetical protein DCC67_15300, partial [Planctomycetota bacterium]